MTGIATTPRHARKGIAYVLALLTLAVLSSLSVAMMSAASLTLHGTENFERAMHAQFAAESGLSFALYKLQGMKGEIKGAGEVDLVQMTYDHLSADLDNTGNLPDGTVILDTTVEGAHTVTVPTITLPSGASFRFTISQVDDDTMLLKVVGTDAGLTRTLSVQLDAQEDTKVAAYAMITRVRAIIRGNVHVEGDICTMWTRNAAAVPFDIVLGTEGEITGKLRTTLSQEAFEAEDSQDSIDSSLHEKLSYDEPAIEEYTTEDFDTAPILAKMTSDGTRNPLPAPDTSVWEQFPQKATGTWFYRPQYANKTLSWTYISPDTHARFTNCTFKGITYIDTVGTTQGSGNNIVFENCTFEGPVVTNVPARFQWQNNSLLFEGDTEFKPNEIAPHLDGTTILAPNFNVNIGDFNKQGTTSDSKITGILVGGIVDIRDNAVIEGTILSMANLDNIGDSSVFYYGSNLGYWEHDAEESGGEVPMTANIRITPSENTTLPIGMRRRYSVVMNPGTYSELGGGAM